MNELKRLDTAANSFEASEIKYLILPSLTIERFRQFEKLQITLGWNADYQTLATGIRKAYDSLQTMKVADASVTLSNLLGGIARKTDGREHEVLLLCSLFVVREGENISEWSETEATEKIADWKRGGYDVADFFDLAWRLVKDFTARLSDGSTNSSDEAAAPIQVQLEELRQLDNTTLTDFGSD
jgi:hypothetical protein